MAGTVIDGKASAARLREKIAAYTAELKSRHGLQPGLATVLVGQDPASEVYVRNKRKTAEAIGFKSVHVELPATASQDELLAHVKALSADPSVHGILVQLPLPKQLDENAVLDALDPAKDVDALTPTNAGLLLSGRAHLVTCTPSGVMMLLKEYVGDIAGKDALVIGRSLLFGKPAAQLLLAANATVTMAHSQYARPAGAGAARRYSGRRHRQAGIRQGGLGQARRDGDRCRHQPRRCRRRQNQDWSAMSIMRQREKWRAPSRRCPAASAP